MTRLPAVAQGKAAFSGSYDPDDVTILLKPSAIATVTVATKEGLIQSGARHYSEMLSAENVPDDRYMALYHAALASNAGRLRADIARLAQDIAQRPATARECVLISLARAGTPIGVLLKRALVRLGVNAHHYSISIIRDRGIDANALAFIAARHCTQTSLFVDGWTGKGTIKSELEKSLANSPPAFDPFLVVVADPAGCADLAATFDDYVIPSGLLNGIVSGLISRSVLRSDLVGPDDFHACLFQREHAGHDLTEHFIHAIETAEVTSTLGGQWTPALASATAMRSRALVDALMAEHRVADVNRIKPGIAEATRAILRRVPDLVFVRDRRDRDTAHLIHLADRSRVPIVERDLHPYRAVTIIKSLGASQQ